MIQPIGMKNKVLAFILAGCLLPFQTFAWNALGHQLIAQIAYDYLTPHARATFNHYNHALDKEYRADSFINAAVWLDSLRHHDVNWFNSLHYIDWYFTEDGSLLPSPQPVNAVWAIKEARRILNSKKSNEFEKGFSLRILLHVVGDLHQPLHAASRVSKSMPAGDRGGNKVALRKNPIADNLHLYWDKGAGLLIGKRFSQSQIMTMAANIEKRWPCKPGLDNKPMHWAQESHDLAVKYVYTLKNNAIPTAQYQRNAQRITEQRLALAGCRLAAMLNQIDKSLLKK